MRKLRTEEGQEKGQEEKEIIFSQGQSRSQKLRGCRGFYFREEKMAKYRCTVCGYIYDPAVGDSSQGIAAGTPFEQLPDTWVCPECGVAKDMFEKI